MKLPDSSSSRLQLTHPEPKENYEIWNLTAEAWKDALTVPLYLEESPYLMTVPLARNGGMTQWILVDRNLPPNQRPLFASCETFRKRSLISDPNGNITEGITHGIASVYCDPRYRRRGYGSRLMKELARNLPSWQTDGSKCVASVLYSDIGKKFYAKVGWHPFPSHHLEFRAAPSEPSRITRILTKDLAALCQEDESMVRDAMARPSKDGKTRFTIMPDIDHMLWHHSKEDWVCERLFGRRPPVKGVLAGRRGSRVWLIWTHRYYSPPASPNCSENTLYILRFVVEDQASLKRLRSSSRGISGDQRSQCEELVANIAAVLRAAQNEAAEWKLYHVKLWAPTPELEQAIKQTGISHRRENREEEGVSSLLWYGKGKGQEKDVEWVGNEKYAWC